jgi:hypothetical protein
MKIGGTNLRRIILAATTIVVLVAAAGAYAATALNTYTGSLTFHSSKPGTPAKPSPASFEELFHVANVNAALNAAPVTDIKLKMYGLRIDFKDFPTCSLAKVTATNGAGCPAKSLVVSGPINALLGSPSLTGAGLNCNPLLNGWNAGGGKVVEFLMISAAHSCSGLQTGAAAPYVVTFRKSGNYLLQDAPLPPDVSTNAGNLGDYSSILTNDLMWLKVTRKVKGKTVAFLSSTGCMHGTRPYSMTFTATNGTAVETKAIGPTNGSC